MTETRDLQNKKGALDRSGSESWEKDNAIARAVTWNEEGAEAKKIAIILGLGQPRHGRIPRNYPRIRSNDKNDH